MSPRGRDEEDDSEGEEEAAETYDSEEEERGGKRPRRGRRSGVESFIDDAASEDDEEDEDEDDDDDEDYGGGGGGKGSKRMKRASILIDDMAQVDDDVEEDEDGEYEPGFIDDDQPNNPDEGVRNSRRHSVPMEEEEEDDTDKILAHLADKYRRHSQYDYAEEDFSEVDQQALLPSVKDPKLWMVKCAIGHERETALCLMQKFIDREDLQIKSVIALEHLKNYIYVEAEKESHVKEACKGLRNIFASAKITQVPTKEMTDVLSVTTKSVDLSRDTWVRIKLGIYKGDLAKVVDVDDVNQKATVKLIPRIDLQALTDKLTKKLNGLKVEKKKKSFVPPPRLFSVGEAREMNIPVERRRHRDSGEYFEVVDGLTFEDGFLRKTVSIKSISTHNVQPSLDELEKFRRVGDDINEDVASLSTLFSNRKKGHFRKGDAVVVVKGDLRNLEGCVEKVEDATVHIRPKQSDLPKTLAFNATDLCKHFNPGDHVKVVSGVQQGATGMVVKVEGHVLIILSDTTKEHIRVFADHLVESSEVTTGITKFGDYELHDLVLLEDNQEDGNSGTWGPWGISPAYQPGTPVVRPFEAPTPGSGWESAPGNGFGDATFNAPTPTAQPMTPIPASYQPQTPGGQPMTPGNAGMDIMSPAIGDEDGSSWLLPDVMVNVSRGDGPTSGVVKEVLPDGSCRVALGPSGSGNEVTALPDELEIIRPKKNDRLKIMNGSLRGVIGKLIGVDGSDGIVRVEGSLEVKIVDLVILGKLAI
ncbi:hypothetical protein ACQ4PT_056194 [Festuca glaucescens]